MKPYLGATLSGAVVRVLLAVSVVATIGCDRLTKHLAAGTLAGAAPRSYFADTVRLEYAENTGGFLGLGDDLPPAMRRAVFVGATGLLMLLLAGMAVRIPRHGAAVPGLAFFVAGGISNWIDRVTHGHVVDFIIMRVGPLHTGVFNVADVAIMIGVGLLLLSELSRQLSSGPAPAA